VEGGYSGNTEEGGYSGNTEEVVGGKGWLSDSPEFNFPSRRLISAPPPSHPTGPHANLRPQSAGAVSRPNPKSVTARYTDVSRRQGGPSSYDEAVSRGAPSSYQPEPEPGSTTTRAAVEDVRAALARRADRLVLEAEASAASVELKYQSRRQYGTNGGVTDGRLSSEVIAEAVQRTLRQSNLKFD